MRLSRRPVHQAAALALSFVCIGLMANRAQCEPARIAVYGDSFATGIFFGMRDVFSRQHGIEVSRRSRGGTGLVRDDHFDWVRQAGDFVQTDRPDIIVISLGGNDRQDFEVEGVTVKRFTAPWWAEYVRRAERVMMDLRASGSAVYWVGIPIVRSPRMKRDFRKLNGLFHDLTRAYGITYVDLWERFRGTDKLYTPYDTLTGERKRIRHPDGIHFTRLGNLRLAQIVAGAMRANLASVR